MKWTTCLMMIAIVNLTAGCPGPVADALFKDVSRRPPDAAPTTIDALKRDEPFASWVIYQDRACDRFGCIP